MTIDRSRVPPWSDEASASDDSEEFRRRIASVHFACLDTFQQTLKGLTLGLLGMLEEHADGPARRGDSGRTGRRRAAGSPEHLEHLVRSTRSLPRTFYRRLEKRLQRMGVEPGHKSEAPSRPAPPTRKRRNRRLAHVKP